MNTLQLVLLSLVSIALTYVALYGVARVVSVAYFRSKLDYFRAIIQETQTGTE